LEISPAEYEEILESFKISYKPPYLHEQKLERLFDLARMVQIIILVIQELLLRKFEWHLVSMLKM
jgi:hypothetical protein